jgi:carbon-monoxide dehydrogenase medium subunit
MSFGSPYTTLPDFEYHSPKTLDEAQALLKEYVDDAKLMGGGIGLIAFMKERLMSPAHVIDLKGVEELKVVRRVPGPGLSIGAAVTLSELLEEGKLGEENEVLRETIARIADPMIRGRATLVGNLCEAIPWVDTPPALMAMDASVEIVGPEGKRSVPVSSFIRGPVDVDLDPTEIVTAVIIPDSKGREGAFEKFTGGSEFGLASVAIVVSGQGKSRSARVVYGAVNSTPIRSTEVEDQIKDGITVGTIRKAAQVASEKVECVDDVLASAAYRKHLVKVITTKALGRMMGR